MAPTYCWGCGYVYAGAADRQMHDRRCGPDDLPAGQELEPSASYPGRGLARHGPSNWTTDYGELARGKP